MIDVARLLFGPEGDRLLDPLAPADEERRMADRVREAGEWCQSTPGADSLQPRRPAGRSRPGHR